MWRSVKFRVVGGVLQWKTRQGERIPADSPPSGGCHRRTQRGPPALSVPPLLLNARPLPRSKAPPGREGGHPAHGPRQPLGSSVQCQ